MSSRRWRIFGIGIVIEKIMSNLELFRKHFITIGIEQRKAGIALHLLVKLSFDDFFIAEKELDSLPERQLDNKW